MIPLFISRPFLGSAVGVLFYSGLAVRCEGLTFLAFLGGLFAMTLIEKLRAMFDTLLDK